MKKTRVCDLLKSKYPIIQGGMLWLATAELVAAVSNVGALGVLSPLAGMELEGDPSENLKDQLTKIKQMTNKPYGVNIPLYLQYAGTLIDIVLQSEAKIVITAAGNPANFTEVLRKNGIKVIHVVSSVNQAKKAESCRVDAVIAAGIEAAAHSGKDELPLFSLIPQVTDAVPMPVIAAGGISDARGVAAAFALGAEGVQLGTRFAAVKENIAHSNYKQAIIDAADVDTVITCRKIVPFRSLRTPFTKRLTALEDSGASNQDLMDFIGYRRNRILQIEGHLDKGEAYCGASAGLIREVLTAQEMVHSLIKGYEEVIKKLPQSLKQINDN
jgi:enoyl-[acyl-carrier protein] reductase II